MPPVVMHALIDIRFTDLLIPGTHWLWEILMMLTRGSAEPRTENKEELMLEEGVDITIQTSNEVDRPRILNTHICHDDMPPSILNNRK